MGIEKIKEMIEELPEDEYAELKEWIVHKGEGEKSKNEGKSENKKYRKAGWAKGALKYMSDDFDEPLDDMKEYMY